MIRQLQVSFNLFTNDSEIALSKNTRRPVILLLSEGSGMDDFEEDHGFQGVSEGGINHRQQNVKG